MKKETLIPTLGIFALIIIASVSLYLKTNIFIAETDEDSPTKDWQTATSTKCDVPFSYPQDWIVTNDLPANSLTTNLEEASQIEFCAFFYDAELPKDPTKGFLYFYKIPVGTIINATPVNTQYDYMNIMKLRGKNAEVELPDRDEKIADSYITYLNGVPLNGYAILGQEFIYNFLWPDDLGETSNSKIRLIIDSIKVN